jgi:hypothetical protein
MTENVKDDELLNDFTFAKALMEIFVIKGCGEVVEVCVTDWRGV